MRKGTASVIGLVLASAFVLGPVLAPPSKAQSGTKLVKLGPQINTATREILPMVSADGRTLFFTRENFVDDDIRRKLLDQYTRGQDEKAKAETIKLIAPMLTDDAFRFFAAKQSTWYSERQADGSWGPAKKLPAPLNNDRSTWICGALPDGNTLLIGGTFDEQLLDPMAGFRKIAEAAEKQAQQLEKSGDLAAFLQGTKGQVQAGQDAAGNKIVALTVRSGSGWSLPEYMKIAGFRTLSNRNDFFLAPGNRVLFLSIVNEESVGDRDLYVSFRQADGGWSKPKDLGPSVNSIAAEICPFMAPDGLTLYFSSRREGGRGEHDIYLTKRLDDSWLKWSSPVNLGPDVNSERDEMDMSVDALGRYAFLSMGEIMKEDIYEFALPEAMRPVPVAFIRGRAHDPDDKPVAAKISYERLRDGVGTGDANADRESGRYQIALPIGQEYGFRAEAPGYIAVSEKIDLTQAKANEEFQRDLLLVPVKVGATIRLNNIFFDFAKSTLLPKSRTELDRLIGLLGQYPKMEIEIAGHTDNVGDDASNLALSEARAAAVKAYLVEHGVAAARLRSVGYGRSRPVATNETDEGRQLNRRVEFVIVKM